MPRDRYSYKLSYGYCFQCVITHWRHSPIFGTMSIETPFDKNPHTHTHNIIGVRSFVSIHSQIVRVPVYIMCNKSVDSVKWPESVFAVFANTLFVHFSMCVVLLLYSNQTMCITRVKIVHLSFEILRTMI